MVERVLKFEESTKTHADENTCKVLVFHEKITVCLLFVELQKTITSTVLLESAAS